MLTQIKIGQKFSLLFPSIILKKHLKVMHVLFKNLGTLLIIPSAGALCAQTKLFNGWPSIFYFSGFSGLVFVVVYLFVGADKPSKQVKF